MEKQNIQAIELISSILTAFLFKLFIYITFLYAYSLILKDARQRL